MAGFSDQDAVEEVLTAGRYCKQVFWQWEEGIKM